MAGWVGGAVVLLAALLFFRKEKAGAEMIARYVKEESPFEAIIDRFARKHRVESALIKAIIQAESSWEPGAVNENEGRGRSSIGLMQILFPDTAKRLGISSKDQLLIPEVNVDAGARLLADIQKRHSALNDIIASYNAGRPKLNSDGTYVNQSYVDRVKSFYRIYGGFDATKRV